MELITVLLLKQLKVVQKINISKIFSFLDTTLLCVIDVKKRWNHLIVWSRNDRPKELFSHSFQIIERAINLEVKYHANKLNK